MAYTVRDRLRQERAALANHRARLVSRDRRLPAGHRAVSTAGLPLVSWPACMARDEFRSWTKTATFDLLLQRHTCSLLTHFLKIPAAIKMEVKSFLSHLVHGTVLITDVIISKAQIPLGSTRHDTFDVSRPCILAVSSYSRTAQLDSLDTTSSTGSTGSTCRARLARLARRVELDRRYLQLSYDHRNSYCLISYSLINWSIH